MAVPQVPRRSPPPPYEHAVAFNSNGIDTTGSRPAPRTTWISRRSSKLAPIARRWASRPSSSTTAGRRARAIGSPTRPSTRSPAGTGAPTRVSGLASRTTAVPRRPRRDRADEARALDEPDLLQPGVGDLRTAPRMGVPADRRRARGAKRGRPRQRLERGRAGPVGPAALPHVEARIREAISSWDVRYFKFDFLVWLDCLEGCDGAATCTTIHDAFVAMLDRLRADHPDVTFQIDETNDYRLFPFESVTRGPTWFQNGGPPVEPHAPQPLEPEPVRPGLRARPERTRQRGLRRTTRSTP